MTCVNLIPTGYREAQQRRRRTRAWFTIFGGYAIILAVAYVGAASALGDGGSTLADLARTTQQVEELSRCANMLKIQLRDAQLKLGVARTVGDQPDWSLLLAILGKLSDDQIVLRSCRLEILAESRILLPAGPKPASQPAAPNGPTKFTLTLTGLGKAQADVTNFVLRLEKLGLFDRVDLLQSLREPVANGEATAFKIECALHARAAGTNG